MLFKRFRFLLLLFFGASAQASDFTCRDSLLPETKPTLDAYATFLRYTPSQTSTVPLFNGAKTDEALRSTLNSKITSDSSLHTASDTGLGFYQWASTFSNSKLTFHEPAREALTPWINLESDYQVFLKTLDSKADRPMSEIEAERKARSDTGTRFGMSLDFSSTLFAEHPEIRFYFQKRRNFYLNQETPSAAPSPSRQEERFRYWLSTKIKNLELERAENLKSLVFETSETLKRPIYFEYRHPTGKNPFFSRTHDFEFLSTSSAKISLLPPDEATLVLSPDHIGERRDLPFYRKVFDSVLWHTPYSRSSTGPETPKEIEDHQSFLTFSVDPDTLKPIEGKISSMGVESSSIHEIKIPVQKLYTFMKERISKSTYPGSLQVTSQVQARLEYEVQLREKISELHLIQGKTSISHFGKWTSTRSAEERELISTSTGTPGMIARFRDLQKNSMQDPLTGLEWFGYAIHPDYWRNRDSIGSQSRTYPALKTINDLWDKSRNITRTGVILGAIATVVTGGIKSAESMGWQLPASSTSTSIRVGESDEARDSFGDESDRDGNGKSDTLFTVSSRRIKQDTYHYIHLPRNDLPRNFNHGTIADLVDPAVLEDVTDRIPHGIFQFSVLDTVTRQTIEVSSHVDQIPVEEHLFLPLPEGYDLAYVDRPYTADSVRIFRNQETGAYVLKIVKSSFSDFNIRAGYVKTTEPLPPVELQTILNDLNRPRLQFVLEQIENAGLSGLAQDLSALLAENRPVSAKDLSNLIQQGQVYSKKPGEGAKWIYRFRENPFLQFRRYLREDGRLHFKCDIANDLFQIMVREIIQDQPDLIVRPLHSYVYEKDTSFHNRSEERGHIGPVGHARTQFILKGKPGKIVLDATPVQEELEVQSPEENGSRFIGPENPGKDQRRRAEGTLPVETRIQSDLRAELERRKKAKQHEEWISILENLTDEMLNQPSFRSQIKSNPREYLPPQRIYILARRVIEFGSGKASQSDLNSVFRTIFGVDVQSPGNDPLPLSKIIQEIATSEMELWNKCSAYFEKSRKVEFIWSQDYQLRNQTEKILQTLQAHDWNPIED
jgi:hypothetical protein